ncbi:MAG: hypothetical protein WBW69_01590 [Candidatus Korobacteraceae bacterium]
MAKIAAQRVALRKNLAERQAAMKTRLLAARETFWHCAFRPMCVERDPKAEPESCRRCAESTLQKLVRRSRPSPR